MLFTFTWNVPVVKTPGTKNNNSEGLFFTTLSILVSVPYSNKEDILSTSSITDKASALVTEESLPTIC